MEEDSFKQGVEEVNALKAKMASKVNRMIVKLDQKAAGMQQLYQTCFDSKCKGLKPQLGNDVLAINDEEVFIKSGASDYVERVEAYNSCVQDCQKDLRSFRYDTEFQMREFQLNLNECFWFCKVRETVGEAATQQSSCIQRCFRIHETMLDKVEQKLTKL